MPEHPCADGLTSACFAAYPAWARQALAYKLLHVILPKQLTKRLPKGLGRALIAPGVILPPGVELPPGTVIFPDVTIPPGWTPGDPAPPGVIIPPGTVFPPGWTPGDPAPPGVVIPSGTVFPPGWTPGDPAPPGVQLPPTISPTPPGSGALAPLYVQPWEPGPVHRFEGGMRQIIFTADGTELTINVDGVWATVRDTLTGASVDTGGELQTVFMRAALLTGSYHIERPIFRFLLSDIPSGAIFSSGYLSLKLIEGVGVTARAQAGPTVIWGDVQDYLSFSGDPSAQNSLVAGENLFTLSADLLTDIQSKVGLSCYIMARESGHDYADSSPGSGYEYRAIFYRHNALVATNRPTLILNY